jgi:hypothetical protein
VNDDEPPGTAPDHPRPVFDHLVRLSDDHGLFEHALLSTPRPEHGYCVDDAARALVVICREPRPDATLRRLARVYLQFVLDALTPDGACRNRMDAAGSWRDLPALGDWWGRALWGLGFAAVHADSAGMRARALSGFRIAAQRRSPFGRAMTFAALGAGELLRTRPDERAARDLLRDALDGVLTDAVSTGTVATVREPDADPDWPWPEPRLRYGNAAVPEALLLGGEALGDATAFAAGLTLLEFLLRVETSRPAEASAAEHFSVTPVGGRGPAEVGDGIPGFDQQPIEVAALADACATAYRLTGDERWRAGVALAWRWFLGENDSATPMFNPTTGGGFDGLNANGRNLNQGAESTLAMLSTAQHARMLCALP